VKHSTIYGVFVCAAALFAAVVGDAVVEGISNSGIFWRGRYTDGSSLDLLPVFLLAIAALIATQVLSLVAQARETGLSTRSLIVSTSRLLAPRAMLRLLPIVFGLQLCMLFSMETTEQIVVYGHLFGGVLWLGGPVAFSLLLHAGIAIGATFALSHVLRALGAALTRIVTSIFARFITCARPVIVSARERVAYVLALIVTASLVERGPPPAISQG
jgi:hypothetical protein